MRYVGGGNCEMLEDLSAGHIMACPVAHGEGRFILPPKTRERDLERMYEEDMVVWRYCHGDGSFAEGEWPVNPNGAYHDIAGICNPYGNVLGLMPHPERAYFGHLIPEWTRLGRPQTYGNGHVFFQSIVNYVRKKF